jgi:hypothetical protein
MSFTCKPCFYKTKSKFNFDRHILTEKHKKLVDEYTTNILEIKNCVDCGKKFRHSSSYYRHLKTCNGIKSNSSGYLTEYSTEYLTDQHELLELMHENEKLKLEMKYQSQLAQKDVEKLKLELEMQEALININQQKKTSVPDMSCQTNTNNYQDIININGDNNTLLTKKDTMNFYFGQTIDIDTFIKNFETKYPLTQEETRTLAENYQHSGIKSYGPGLLCYLKKNYKRQIKDITGQEPDDDVVMPFLSSDGTLRTHLEKASEGWKIVKDITKIDRIIIVSNDYIYNYHTTHLPIGSKERKIVSNSMLRNSTYDNAKEIARKKDMLKKTF